MYALRGSGYNAFSHKLKLLKILQLLLSKDPFKSIAKHYFLKTELRSSNCSENGSFLVPSKFEICMLRCFESIANSSTFEAWFHLTPFSYLSDTKFLGKNTWKPSMISFVLSCKSSCLWATDEARAAISNALNVVFICKTWRVTLCKTDTAKPFRLCNSPQIYRQIATYVTYETLLFCTVILSSVRYSFPLIRAKEPKVLTAIGDTDWIVPRLGWRFDVLFTKWHHLLLF